MKRMMFIATLAVFIAGHLFGGTITVTQPAGGNVEMGSACPIAWTATGVTSNVRINLIAPGGALVGAIIGNQLPGGSPYNWTVGSPAVVGESYRVRVVASDGSGVGESAVFTVIAGGGDPGSAGTISNVRLSGTSPHRIGDSRTISWAVTGVSQPLRLQLTRTGGDVVGVIADPLPAGTTSYNWPAGQYVGGTASPGEDYKIRVSAADNSAASKSPEFALSNFLVVTDLVLTTAFAARDLELRSVRYVFNRGGWIVARVKNHLNPIDQDVRFHLVFPEMVRDGSQTFTKPVNLAAGAEGDIYLFALPQNDIPLRGLLTRVTVDGPSSQITETNENNNTLETRIAILDISCSAPRSELQLSKLYVQDKDFRVRFKIRVRHNLAEELRNIHVQWTLHSPENLLQTYSRTIESLAPGAEHVWNVDEKYDKTGSFAAHQPTLSEETTYRVVAGIQDASDVFHDVNPRNDSSGFSFSFPD